MDYAVIMAGGTGKRLWPLSRRKRPKQVLRLLDGQTLLRRCYDRLRPVFTPERILVLTNAAYVDIVRENLPELPEDHVIAEPAVRDTAGAIGLAATALYHQDAEATMAVVTADQVIEPVPTFAQALSDALAYIHGHPDSMMVFAIEPTHPSTQFGYLKLSPGRVEPELANPICRVESFREKPDAETARQYVQSGEYGWNSGMFVWKAGTILEALRRFLPESQEPLDRIGRAWLTAQRRQVLEEWFPRMPRISIDFAVMEKAQDVQAIRLDCRWLDMGSFQSLRDMIKGDPKNNVVAAGKTHLMECNDNIIVTEDEGHLIALIGVEDLVVAHSRDATLICPVGQADRLKELLERIEEEGGGCYL